MPAPRTSPAAPHRLAVWYGKGGVGKSTTTTVLALMAAARGQDVLVVDLDPESGTSRNFLGPDVNGIDRNIVSFLAAPLPEPLPIVRSGIDGLDLVPSSPRQQRFFRLYPEQSTRLREGLALLPPAYRWVLMDVPNQFENIAELGLIAADHLILPVELTADCLERVGTVLSILEAARFGNPGLKVLGALALASAPVSARDMRLSAKERLVYREYQTAFAAAGIPMFRTLMFRSATTVEEARSNADLGLMHWVARQRFQALFVEVCARIKASTTISLPTRHDRPAHSRHRQGRATAPANA